jgi:hypothetical protein
MSRNSINATAIFPLLIVLFSIVSTAWGFSTISPSASGQSPASGQHQQRVTELHVSESSGGDSSEVIARKIIVTGDVDGGYYRSCVKNEVCVFCSVLINISYSLTQITGDVFLYFTT